MGRRTQGCSDGREMCHTSSWSGGGGGLRPGLRLGARDPDGVTAAALAVGMDVERFYDEPSAAQTTLEGSIWLGGPHAEYSARSEGLLCGR
jgi:hypothetical protein